VTAAAYPANQVPASTAARRSLTHAPPPGDPVGGPETPILPALRHEGQW
jgi:hypothetical protein